MGNPLLQEQFVGDRRMAIGIAWIRILGEFIQGRETVAIGVEVVGSECLGKFCAQEFAQRNITARNDANAICSARVEATATTRTLSPGATP